MAFEIGKPYEFDMNSDQFIRRVGYEWNHPSMKGIEPMNCSAPAHMILDPNKTLDEQLATQAAITEQLGAQLVQPDPEIMAQIETDELIVPGLPGEPDVRCLIVKPKEMPKYRVPCLVHAFGGGMVMGCPDMQLAELAGYVVALGCVVVAVQYRLLPKWQYPAAVNDVEAVTIYLREHAKELGISLKRTVITGQSAGGYVSACTTQRLKMRGEWQFAGQLLVYPLMDDSFSFPSSNLYYGEVWQPKDDEVVFNHLFGPNYTRSAMPADAMPLNCKDYRGLPPTVMITGDCDYGHDPVIKYAQGIMDAGIYCDLHVFGGCMHGFMAMAPGTDISNRALRDVTEGLRDLMTGECVRE